MQVNRFRRDQGAGLCRRIRREDEFTLVGFVTSSRLDVVVVAQRKVLLSQSLCRGASGTASYIRAAIGVRYTDEIHVIPLEDDHTGYRIFRFGGDASVQELDEDERVDRSSPRFAIVHSYRNKLHVVVERRRCLPAQ